MLKEINLLSKGPLLIRALCLMGVIFLFGLVGFVGSPQAEAFHAGYKPPIFPSSGIITSFTDSTQNSLNVSVSGRSGIFEAHCGSSDNAAVTITGPYFMSHGSISVSSVTEQVTSGEIQQTAAGSAGSGCSDTGQAGSFQVGQTLNVAGLSNGTYTLSVNLCATSSGPCSTSTKLITINRVTPTDPPLSGSCTGMPSQPAPGQTVTWTTSASGGTGSYIYSWSGAVSGAGATRTASYSTTGTKTANVTITSGGQNVTKSCSVNVQPPPDDTCTIEVTSNRGTQWIIGGDGFTSYLANGQNPDTYEIYSPNPDSHPMRVDDGFGIIASELAGYTQAVSPSANQTCETAGQKVTFNIQYTAVPSTGGPSCTGPSSGYVGQNLQFSASGGTNTGFTWSGGQNPSPTGNGASFTTSFSTTGSKTVTVRDSANNPGTCTLSITSAPTALYCTASPSGVSPGGATTLTAGGGTNTGYTWTTGGSPASPSGSPVNVTYSTSGSKTVTVRDSSGAQAQCYVSVYNTTTPVCSPATQTVNVGQTANFGTSPWGWTGTWFSPGGTPERHAHSYISTYSTTYSTPGTKTVWYTRNSSSSTCTVNVVTPQVNNASCIAMSYPTQVVTGQQFQASVTMQNTGTIDWKVPLHRLGSKNPNGNNVWGLTRVNMPSSPVNVGQQVTFNFTATAPSTAGTRSFDWGMLEETIEWFGQTCVASPQINVVAGGTVNVTSNIATTWRLTGPDGIVNQTAPAISQSYISKPAGSYTISNIPMVAGYNTPAVTPASSQTLGAGATVTFAINYRCIDQDGDNKCDHVDGCQDPDGCDDPPGPDNCPDDYNPDQADSDGDGIGDACDGGEPPEGPEGGADFALSSTNNIRVDKNAGETRSNTTTVKVTPYGGFGESVAIREISGPAVDYFFGDSTLTSGEYSTGSSFYVQIPSGFPRGNYPIQIRGLSGEKERTTTVILSVDESGPRFDEF